MKSNYEQPIYHPVIVNLHDGWEGTIVDVPSIKFKLLAYASYLPVFRQYEMSRKEELKEALDQCDTQSAFLAMEVDETGVVVGMFWVISSDFERITMPLTKQLHKLE